MLIRKTRENVTAITALNLVRRAAVAVAARPRVGWRPAAAP